MKETSTTLLQCLWRGSPSCMSISYVKIDSSLAVRIDDIMSACLPERGGVINKRNHYPDRIRAEIRTFVNERSILAAGREVHQTGYIAKAKGWSDSLADSTLLIAIVYSCWGPRLLPLILRHSNYRCREHRRQ